ncbi:MAG: hypothetical protein UV73_C0015G0031 [Candidatus Gottesmanbacteria bacterium GW2011_GWA2_43_14]|uniref:Permease n=1 Tax=Candidatus Gottesmanbacteria bacterium GW2011_GWA2_43_14 TaxID=1618443 RepID=A0A0G1FKU0_9BACT|nr:MAG: hypothetical protein UV73_C0015G0031 [Candidatus Gottesmanbacteria bacterium GW2011_GWA2_43_14]
MTDLYYLQLIKDTFFQYSKVILPWFLIGIAVTYYAEKYLFKPEFFKRFIGPVTFPKILISQALGMLSPLSIMSFLPLAGELIQDGINPAFLFSFLIAERAYDIQSFFIITGLFGFKIALLNALVIFISLVVTSYFIKRESVAVINHAPIKLNHFFSRQFKMLLIIMAGIIIASLLRSLLPEEYMIRTASNPLGGTIVSLVLGLVLYFGPIAGNYPIARAFADLGMSNTGVFSFLTVSPLFNIVIMSLFSAVVGIKLVGKAVLIYVVTSLVLILLINPFL